MREVKIPFIYADNCKHCNDALRTIETAICKVGEIPCEIIKFRYNEQAAIAIAAAQGIETLPGFVVGLTPFQGSDYSEEKIIEAIKKAADAKS